VGIKQIGVVGQGVGEALLQLCLCVLMTIKSKRCANSVVGARECEERPPKKEVGSAMEEGKGHAWGLDFGSGVSMAVLGRCHDVDYDDDSGFGVWGLGCRVLCSAPSNDMYVRVKEVGDGGEWANQQRLQILEIIKYRSDRHW
jgi:hypothetical protein